MSALPESSAVITEPLAPTPPAWVRAYVSRQQPSPLTLLSTNIPHATSLSAEGLGDAVADAYRAILRDVRSHERHAVRVWNFVPSIHGELGPGNRYMAFNAGRFAAFSGSFDMSEDHAAAIPTASAVGIDGTMLWIHVLASDVPGMAVENPRQVPAYRYSPRYGPRPPCFARATRLDSTLLIGGTASIVGEDSRHVENVAAQTHETLSNLRSVIAAATGALEEDALKMIRDARVHVTDVQHAPVVRDALAQVLCPDAQVEFVEAELCRKELLVEIEGLAACG